MIPGILAFILIFLGDVNDLKWREPWLRLLFPVGFFLLSVSTLLQIMKSAPFQHAWLLLPALVFLVLLIVTLFFQIPAQEAYVTQERGRTVCSSGFYGICRHPGIWWFWGLYLCLWAAGAIPFATAAVYSLLDLALAVFEDRVVFPVTLSGYKEYCEKVPFLIPGLHRR